MMEKLTISRTSYENATIGRKVWKCAEMGTFGRSFGDMLLLDVTESGRTGKSVKNFREVLYSGENENTGIERGTVQLHVWTWKML